MYDWLLEQFFPDCGSGPTSEAQAFFGGWQKVFETFQNNLASSLIQFLEENC